MSQFGDTNQSTVEQIIRLANSLQHTTAIPPKQRRHTKKMKYRGRIEQLWLMKYKGIL